MNRFCLSCLPALSLLLSACGVSSSQKEAAASDFLSKVSALYLRPGIPAVVVSAELDNFEKGDYMGAGSFYALFSLELATDGGSVYLNGTAAFNEAGRLVMDSDSTFAVYPLVIYDEHGKRLALDSPCVIKEFH